ncbi:MAG: transglycosylase domain-containing protein, partial [Actinomycetota bacterium]
MSQTRTGRSGRRSKREDPRSRAQKILLRYGWLLPLAAIFVGGGILMLTYAFASIPLPRDIETPSSAEVFDVHGRKIGSFSDEITRFLIDTEELIGEKPFIAQAVISAEDRDFYEHNGVSVRGIARAAWANLTGGEVQQGGSTITQQYVKNAVLQDNERTVTRKAKEAILAIKLERRHSKKEILGFYLNTIYFGRGAYGIEAAARAYFDKPAKDLELGEMAYLAGIIPAPESYQPEDGQAAARGRRDRVLDLMVGEGYIEESEAEAGKQGKIKLSEQAKLATRNRPQASAYFMEWLRKEYLYEEYKDELYTRGFKIYTTLDLGMQRAAEEAVTANLTEPTDPQAALVSMTPAGELRAMVGGKDFDNTLKARGFNFATTYPGRQPGSSLKPFTLLAAIEEGVSPRSAFSGASPMFVDENPLCNNSDGSPWEVDNYGGTPYGTLDLVAATTNSVNTVYAQLVAEIGPEVVADTLEDFGYQPKFGEEEITPNCSNALGGSLDVTPLEQARAYAALAGRGALPDVNPIRYITDSDGDCVKEYLPQKGSCEQEIGNKNQPEQVVEQNSVDVLNESLTSVVTSGTATSANIGRPVAGKTGTTGNNGNAWFAGYTPQLSTVVWLGYPFEPGPDGRFATECGLKTKSDDKRIEKQNECGADDFIPEMRACADPVLCRVVHGLTGGVTGGSI